MARGRKKQGPQTGLRAGTAEAPGSRGGWEEGVGSLRGGRRPWHGTQTMIRDEPGAVCARGSAGVETEGTPLPRPGGKKDVFSGQKGLSVVVGGVGTGLVPSGTKVLLRVAVVSLY